MAKNIFDTLRQGIEKDVYKSVRLVKIKENNEREMLLTYTRVSGTKEEALQRLDNIKYQLQKKLPPGKYLIEARMGRLASSLTDSFPYEVKMPVTYQISSSSEPGNSSEEVQDKTHEQENSMAREIDFDDYKTLIDDNANLKAIIKILEHKLEVAESKMAEPLKDSSPLEAVGSILKENLPTAMNLISKYFDQRDESNKLKHRELTLQENGTAPKQKKKVMGKSKAQILNEMAALYDSDEEAFNNAMDDLQVSNPSAYDFVCEQLELTEEEEEEQEEEEEEQENQN